MCLCTNRIAEAHGQLDVADISWNIRLPSNAQHLIKGWRDGDICTSDMAGIFPTPSGTSATKIDGATNTLGSRFNLGQQST
jgi:hypothetical protein